MRAKARAVVIGGGVGGCSVLYWLARLGWDDVVLVERADLTSGSTFHSAGLVGQLRSSLSLTRMMMESVDLYRTLEAEVGLETGWREVGSLRLASSEERMEEIARQAGWAKTFGLPLELISPAEAQALFPPMSTDGVLGAAYLPTDGYIDPSQLTFALAEGARRRGAEVNTGTRVTAISAERGRVTGVETDRGEIETEIVVNAGGMFAGEIGALAGVTVPVDPDGARVPRPRAVRAAARHADDARPVAPRLLPPRVGRADHGRLRAALRAVVARRDPGGLQRQAARGGLAALRGADAERGRPRPVARGDGRRPADQRARGVHARRRVRPRADRRPGLLGRGRLLRARARRRRRHGAARRRVDRRGDALARRLAHGLAPLRRGVPLARVHARPHEGGLRDVLRRQVPGSRARGRPAAARLGGQPAAAGARRGVRGEVGLGARELVRAERGGQGDEALRPRGWAGELWSPAIGAEHRACRETAALFDESSFAKLEVSGPGAADFLEGLCANRVARETGRVTYTQMLNPRGGIECDFTVTRLGPERFRIVTGTAFGQHDAAWIRQHAPGRRVGPRRRRDVGLRVPRPLGAGEPGDPPAAHGRRPRRTRRSRT